MGAQYSDVNLAVNTLFQKNEQIDEKDVFWLKSKQMLVISMAWRSYVGISPLYSYLFTFFG